MDFNLKNLLKALLFSTAEPLSVKDVQAVITRYHQGRPASNGEKPEAGSGENAGDEGVEEVARVPSLLTATQIREAMDEIGRELKEHRDVFQLEEGPNGYRLCVDPDYSDWVRLLRKEPRPQRLSAASLETLAIIAYRQPVTRAEIEAIRGVSADGAVSKLLEKELAQVIGRADLPGRPIQYGTTDKFLEYCGLRSVEELPASDVLSPNQLTEWIRRATNPVKEASDADVGLEETEANVELQKEMDYGE